MRYATRDTEYRSAEYEWRLDPGLLVLCAKTTYAHHINDHVLTVGRLSCSPLLNQHYFRRRVTRDGDEMKI
jgi:hypothetical protein